MDLVEHKAWCSLKQQIIHLIYHHSHQFQHQPLSRQVIDAVIQYLSVGAPVWNANLCILIIQLALNLPGWASVGKWFSTFVTPQVTPQHRFLSQGGHTGFFLRGSHRLLSHWQLLSLTQSSYQMQKNIYHFYTLCCMAAILDDLLFTISSSSAGMKFCNMLSAVVSRWPWPWQTDEYRLLKSRSRD